MADLKFIGVNLPSSPKYRQGNPPTDRLLVDIIGPTGGPGGGLTVSPVASIDGDDVILDLQNGSESVVRIVGDGTIVSNRQWVNGQDHSWAPVIVLDPAGSASFGTKGEVQILVGSGVDPRIGSGVGSSSNPPSGSLLLSTDGTAWLKSDTTPTSWTKWGPNGYVDAPVAVVAGTTNISVLDSLFHVNDTAGQVTFNLPDPASHRRFSIQKVAGTTGGIVLHPFSSEKIMNAASNYTLPSSTTSFSAATPQSWTVYSNGVDWYVSLGLSL